MHNKGKAPIHGANCVHEREREFCFPFVVLADSAIVIKLVEDWSIAAFGHVVVDQGVMAVEAYQIEDHYLVHMSPCQ